MRKTKIFAIGLLLFMVLPLFILTPFSPNQFVSADIDTVTLEDDFEEKYYNNIYSQYENATITVPQNSFTLRPNALGTHNQLQTAGDDPAWRCIDDVSPDDDDTWVGSTSLIVEQTATANIEDLGSVSGTIQNVTIYFHAKKTINDGYYYLTIRTSDGNLYNTSIPINNAWITYEVVLGGSTMKLDTYSARLSQVYCIVYTDPDAELGSTTTYKKQDTSYYRAFGGLYSYFHNVSRNYTSFGEIIKHNSSIIIDFMTLNIFPQALVFFLYFNCFYNISLFIGTEEYVLKTHNYSIEDWKYIDIRLERKDYLITDINADFYIKIYPIENNNTHDVFYMDNLKVRYTDPEQAIDYSHRCVVGEQYDDYVSINATSSSFYAKGTGVNPAGWLDYYTTQAWRYETHSNTIMSRGMKLNNFWTLYDYEPVNDFFVDTEINMTIDKEYYIYDSLHFIATGSAGKVSVSRQLYLYIDNNLILYMYNQSIIDKGFPNDYYELSHIIELNQLNEHTMQYASSFSNFYTNITDWRPLIFSINEDIQFGLNIMSYTQMTHYTVDVESASNPTIFQKTIVDIHNSPISDFTIPDIEGGFFRSIWERLLYYIGRSTGIEGLLWQQLNLERAYNELMIDMINDLIEGVDNPNWLEDYYQDIQDIQDTYAGGIVSTWRNLFSNDDYSGLETRFDNRWGGLFRKATQGEESFFTRMFGRIFGENIGFIPQLIWSFFGNFINWIVIFFVMFLVMFMKAIMKRDYDRVKGIIGGSISVILFIVQVVKWFIGFIIRILTMIGGFIPFT